MLIVRVIFVVCVNVVVVIVVVVVVIVAVDIRDSHRILSRHWTLKSI
jgi:hypothetical protein